MFDLSTTTPNTTLLNPIPTANYLAIANITYDYLVSNYGTTSAEAKGVKPKEEEAKETAMSLEQNQIEYLNNRVYDVYRSFDLSGMFNIYVNNSPKTYKELIDAIKNDKFKLDEKRTKRVDELVENCDFWDSAFDGIIWDGPQPDYDGYEQARKELKAAFIATKDAINVLPPAEGLKALQEFEKFEPSNKPTVTN